MWFEAFLSVPFALSHHFKLTYCDGRVIPMSGKTNVTNNVVFEFSSLGKHTQPTTNCENKYLESFGLLLDPM